MSYRGRRWSGICGQPTECCAEKAKLNERLWQQFGTNDCGTTTCMKTCWAMLSGRRILCDGGAAHCRKTGSFPLLLLSLLLLFFLLQWRSLVGYQEQLTLERWTLSTHMCTYFGCSTVVCVRMNIWHDITNCGHLDSRLRGETKQALRGRVTAEMTEVLSLNELNYREILSFQNLVFWYLYK